MLFDRIGTSLLKLFCRPAAAPDYPMRGIHYGEADALAHTSVFPDFQLAVTGKDVLDFGCGHGYQTLALAHLGVRTATGVEIDPALLASARTRALNATVPVTFSSEMTETYDVIYSQNSFEHFLDPDGICSAWVAHLRPGGRIYITFAPPWLSPRGAHMGFFTRLPWVHLLFPERMVMALRTRYRNDGARTYYECGLGKMTIKRFEETIGRTGLRVAFRRYDCVRRMNFLGKIPLVRELFINRVSCILA